jgi:hypothetical protein
VFANPTNPAVRWTNGLFKSTLHRVVNTAGRERYSCAFFFEPNFNTRVEVRGVADTALGSQLRRRKLTVLLLCLAGCVQVLPCCISEERPAAYPHTTAGEHLLSKYAATHAGYDAGQKQQRQQQQQEAED